MIRIYHLEIMAFFYKNLLILFMTSNPILTWKKKGSMKLGLSHDLKRLCMYINYMQFIQTSKWLNIPVKNIKFVLSLPTVSTKKILKATGQIYVYIIVNIIIK